MSVSEGQIALVRKAELRRHDADDLVGGAVELERLAQNIGAARKHIPPQRMANDNHAILPWLLVFRADGSARFRRCFERTEEIGVDLRGAHAGYIIICSEVVGRLVEERHRSKGMGLRFEVEEICVAGSKGLRGQIEARI